MFGLGKKNNNKHRCPCGRFAEKPGQHSGACAWRDGKNKKTRHKFQPSLNQNPQGENLTENSSAIFSAFNNYNTMGSEYDWEQWENHWSSQTPDPWEGINPDESWNISPIEPTNENPANSNDPWVNWKNEWNTPTPDPWEGIDLDAPVETFQPAPLNHIGLTKEQDWGSTVDNRPDRVQGQDGKPYLNIPLADRRKAGEKVTFNGENFIPYNAESRTDITEDLKTAHNIHDTVKSSTSYQDIYDDIISDPRTSRTTHDLLYERYTAKPYLDKLVAARNAAKPGQKFTSPDLPRNVWSYQHAASKSPYTPEYILSELSKSAISDEVRVNLAAHPFLPDKDLDRILAQPGNGQRITEAALANKARREQLSTERNYGKYKRNPTTLMYSQLDNR